MTYAQVVFRAAFACLLGATAGRILFSEWFSHQTRGRFAYIRKDERFHERVFAVSQVVLWVSGLFVLGKVALFMPTGALVGYCLTSMTRRWIRRPNREDVSA